MLVGNATRLSPLSEKECYAVISIKTGWYHGSTISSLVLFGWDKIVLLFSCDYTKGGKYA